MSRPRVGFLGVGWIGRHRMEAMLAGGMIEAAAICDLDAGLAREALRLAPDAAVVADLDAMLSLGLDGVAVATPSALHAAQAISGLDAGVAVFCQKPLGRNVEEVAGVVAAARRADRLLTVDFSYRHARAVREIVDLVRAGRLGRVFAVDLVFHNAYGPDKPWFYDRAQSGGGCLMDLGSHLVDLAHWIVGSNSPAADVAAALLAAGARVEPGGEVEDYASASFSLDGGVAVRLACSWRLHAGRDAEIGVAVYGTDGGAALRNVDGSFYDFEASIFERTSRRTLVEPPDAWGGRAAAAWAENLNRSRRFNPEAQDYVAAAETLDRIYAASRRGASPR